MYTVFECVEWLVCVGKNNMLPKSKPMPMSMVIQVFLLLQGREKEIKYKTILSKGDVVDGNDVDLMWARRMGGLGEVRDFLVVYSCF